MIIAAGLTLAVVVGELDLSIGFAASLHGILVTGLIVSNRLPIPLAVALVLGAGALIGLVNGLIVTKARVNSVIATLGVGTIQAGTLQIVSAVLSGTCAALTGILRASRLGSGTASAADGYLLTAFAAVFLGSATLRDGEFHVLGTLVGALIIAFGFNGLNIFGAPTFSQYVLQGAILILAVGLSSLGRSIAES